MPMSVRANWLAVDMAGGASYCSVMVSVVLVAVTRVAVAVIVDRAIGARSHCASWAIGSIKRSTAQAASLVCTPASLAGEESIVEAIGGAGTTAINKR